MATKKLKNDFTVLIGGKEVVVRLVQGLRVVDEDCMGSFSEESDGTLLVKIDKDVSGDNLYYAVAHELFHALLHITGYAYILEKVHDGMEEGLTRVVENLYVPCIKNLEKTLEENT